MHFVAASLSLGHVTNTQALVKFMMGQKVIDYRCHQAFLSASEITDIPELHDRLIAATARYFDVPLITNDPVIRKSKFVKILE